MARSQPPELCHHVKANGKCCESPALRDQPFCFFHVSVRERTKRMRRAARLKLPFQLPVLEDREAIQLAIGDVMNALLAGQIDHKTAGLLLYGLQTASANAQHLRFYTFASDRVYEQYHNQEEERLEREIQAEIAEEQKSKPPQSAPSAKPEPNLPPKKAPLAATREELIDTACKLAMIEAAQIKQRVKGKPNPLPIPKS